MYDPQDSQDSYGNGCYVFETLEDMLQAKKLPRVVVATNTVYARSGHNTATALVAKNEVLIIPEV